MGELRLFYLQLSPRILLLFGLHLIQWLNFGCIHIPCFEFVCVDGVPVDEQIDDGAIVGCEIAYKLLENGVGESIVLQSIGK